MADYRESREWQEAQAEYLSDDGDPDERFHRRVEAAIRMRDIQRAWAAGVRAREYRARAEDSPAGTSPNAGVL